MCGKREQQEGDVDVQVCDVGRTEGIQVVSPLKIRRGLNRGRRERETAVRENRRRKSEWIKWGYSTNGKEEKING